ncbi:hypothetical protein OZZ08_06190 [Malaciobacter mytili]|uniref:hypothetical protein n=1 Tax=Malaciobacter mytili TaxID=603050 RepID=UPI003BB21D3F
MYVQVFEDHLIAYNYRKVNYGDIILFRPYNNSFDFQTETSGMSSLVLFNNNNAVYMNYLVRQYYHHIGRKIETV